MSQKPDGKEHRFLGLFRKKWRQHHGVRRKWCANGGQEEADLNPGCGEFKGMDKGRTSPSFTVLLFCNAGA